MNKVIKILFMLILVITLFACSSKVVVEFETNGGNEIHKVEIEKGADFVLPMEPEKEGYEFVGWYLDPAFSEEFKSIDDLKGTIKLYAKWEKIKKYTVEFKNVDLNSIEVIDGDKITKPVDPIKEGFVFIGWYSDETLENVYDFDTQVNNNLTLYAKFEEEVNKYDVVFKGFNGEELATISVVEGDDIPETLIPNAPIVEGYEFKGWDKELSNITSDLEIKAVYEQIILELKVEFKNVEIDSAIVIRGEKLTVPIISEKEGYIFGGWFTDDSLQNPYDFDSVVKDDLVLYAKFDGIKYTINYNLSGGKCDNLVNEFTNGAEVTLPTPTKEGNTFLGWFENGVKVEKLENKNYDLVARWETAKYTITYDLDGGTCYDLITEFKHDEDITLPTPSKDGFIFEGWFEGETKVEEITNKNYELKAKWRQFVPCTVNYDLDGGMFTYGYQTSAEIGDAFFNDFVKYSNGTYANESDVKEPTKSLFQNQSHPSVKISLANAEMLAKWNWLWKYMLVHLKEYNATQTSAYITDTYPVLEKMINGDTNAINENANARTSIRSYLHGLINSMKGCGDSNPTFAVYSPVISNFPGLHSPSFNFIPSANFFTIFSVTGISNVTSYIFLTCFLGESIL